MPTVLRSGADHERAKQGQKEAARLLFGADADASSRAHVNLPHTPPEYAELVWYDWAGTYHAACLAEVAPEGSFATSSLLEVATSQKRLLRPEELASFSSRGLHLTAGMTRALQSALDAGVRGATRLNLAGVKILSGSACAHFWGKIGEYVINLTATRGVVTDRERWKAFAAGLGESAQAVGDAVGRVAAGVVSTAGRSIGAGVGGFFQELGVVQSVIVLGAGYAAFRIL